MILIGVLVPCLILFLSFRNYKTTHYTISFTAAEITSTKNIQVGQQPSSRQLLPVKENLEAKKECLSFYPEEYQNYIYFKKENIEAIVRCGGIYVEEEFAEPFNIVKWIR